ncbi:MAG: hypothetical protein M3014_11595 [Chloroflexota bacterium]|nr:hypothetical protein [Chloroflexota bacterium]
MSQFGACGVAALLMLELTDYTVIERAPQGSGVDYYLAYRDTELPFERAARLEVSGIGSGSIAEVRKRVNEKTKQTYPSDQGGLPAYIVVVEFGQPMAQVVTK